MVFRRTPGPAKAINTITGLTVGTNYQFSFWGSPFDDSYVTNLTFGVTGISSSTGTIATGTSDKWFQFFYSFTATATSHEFFIQSATSAGATVPVGLAVDDVQVIEPAQAVVVPAVTQPAGSSAVLDVSDGTVTLDESQLPYGSLSLNASVANEGIVPAGATIYQVVYAYLDPTKSPRIQVTATDLDTETGVTVTREFDLLLTGRTINPVDGTIDITAATDDSLLNYFKLNAGTPDASYLAHQSSLVAVTNAVLAKSGITGTLDPSSADADVTTLTSLTNLLPNGSAETTVTGWSSGSFAVARVTGTAKVGTACIRATSSTTGTQNLNASVNLAVDAGQQYTFSFWVQAATLTRLVAGVLRFFNSSGTSLGDNGGTAVREIAGQWVHYTVTATAPGGATAVLPYVQFQATTSGEVHYIDAAMLLEGDGLETDGVNPVFYFDGSTAGTATYGYAWTGTVGASASTRTPVFERDPASLTWQPGDSAWDFIGPVLSAAGVSIVCDEKRVWRLYTPDYIPEGQLVLTPTSNLFDGTDEISRDLTAVDGSPLYFDACLVVYTWTDQNGLQQIRYDSYALPGGAGILWTINYAKAYPGPGAAAYIVNSVQGRARQFATDAQIDLTATPGMALNMTFPYVDSQVGFVSSVAWSFLADTMQVTSRGLISTPPSAWLYQPAGKSWASVPAGVPWTAGA
jgi:hypothetical protein